MIAGGDGGWVWKAEGRWTPYTLAAFVYMTDPTRGAKLLAQVSALKPKE